MAGKKVRVSGGKEIPNKQYCSDHDEVCQPVMVMPKRKMRYRCPQGCDLSKKGVIVK